MIHFDPDHPSNFSEACANSLQRAQEQLLNEIYPPDKPCVLSSCPYYAARWPTPPELVALGRPPFYYACQKGHMDYPISVL